MQCLQECNKAEANPNPDDEFGVEIYFQNTLRLCHNSIFKHCSIGGITKQPSSKRKKTSAASSHDTPPDNQDLEDISHQVDPASATITVTAVEVPELTDQEQSDRLHLERKVERAFFEAGKALAELRDRRLYRSTHRTFEEYCR